jgi:hypothetical protein
MNSNSVVDIQKEEPETTKQADKLVSMIEKSNMALFHDEFDEPYARFRVGEHFEIWKIRSKNFRRWLCSLYWEKYKQVPNNESINAAYNVIEANACFQGQKYQLYNRVAFYNDSIWYDLGDWRAVRINSQGWGISSDPPILFRSYSHQKVQTEPLMCSKEEVSEALDTLSSLINIKFYLVNLINMLSIHNAYSDV